MIRLDTLLLGVFIAGMPFVTATLAAQTADDASAAQAADDAPTYGNWTVRCQEPSDAGKKSCFIFQNLVLREGGQRVLQVAVGYVPDAKDPVVLLSLPLGISLPPGVSTRVDDDDPKRFSVERCEPNGCRAGFKLTPQLLEKFGSGQQLTVTFHDGRRQPIEVPLSLDGFNRGLVAIRNAN
jgi:invasion protein IalB